MARESRVPERGRSVSKGYDTHIHIKNYALRASPKEERNKKEATPVNVPELAWPLSNAFCFA